MDTIPYRSPSTQAYCKKQRGILQHWQQRQQVWSTLALVTSGVYSGVVFIFAVAMLQEILPAHICASHYCCWQRRAGSGGRSSQVNCAAGVLLLLASRQDHALRFDPGQWGVVAAD